MDPTEIVSSLADTEGRADPYPLYAALHELGEAVELSPRDVIVTGYEAIEAVLRGPRFRVSDESAFDRNFPRWPAHPVLLHRADRILDLHAPRRDRINSVIA